jgi:hypothetical protein
MNFAQNQSASCGFMMADTIARSGDGSYPRRREPSAGLMGYGDCVEGAPMRAIVGFIQLACALTLGMAGGWTVHQMGLVMGWNGF